MNTTFHAVFVQVFGSI